MELVVALCVGILIGVVGSNVFKRTHSIGCIRIDTSDPDDNPYLFLELSKSVDALAKYPYVVLKVDLKSFISRK